MTDQIWLGFSVGIESDLFFVRGIEIDRVRAEINLFPAWSIDLVFCGYRNWLDFWMRAAHRLVLVSIEIDVFLVWVVDIDCISVRGVELDLITV